MQKLKVENRKKAERKKKSIEEKSANKANQEITYLKTNNDSKKNITFEKGLLFP